MSVNKLAFLVLCFSLLYAGGSVMVGNVFAGSQASFESALSEIKDCTEEENAVICAKPSIEKILGIMSGAEVMEVLEARFTPQQCHYLGHLVGQLSYMKLHSVEGAIAQCTRACDSACVHGIIGEAFAEELGLPSVDAYADLDLRHLNPEELRVIGRKLCATIGTCHGVGHALFQIYHAFEPAFAECREVAGTMLSKCYNGVTMEYADILSSRNMGAASEIEFPAQEDLDTFCIFPTIPESRACFRYFPRMVVNALARDGISREEALSRVQDICNSYKSARVRIACFGGFGSYGSYSVLTDIPEAVSSCAALNSEQAEAACIVGGVGVATEDRTNQLASYCTAMTNEKMRTICYQSLFFFLNRIGVSFQDFGRLCSTDDSACRIGLADHKLDPVEKIVNFPR